MVYSGVLISFTGCKLITSDFFIALRTHPSLSYYQSQYKKNSRYIQNQKQ